MNTVIHLVTVVFSASLVFSWSRVPVSGPTPSVGDCCVLHGTHASCSHCQSTVVPAHLPSNTTHLQLAGSCIRSLDFGRLGWLRQLQLLNASHCQVSRVGGAAARLRQLRLIDLSHNRLRHVPPAMLRGLLQLRALNLSHNRIAVVSPAGLVAPRLTLLDLGHNNLAALTRTTLADLPVLSELRLTYNRLTRVVAGAFTSSGANFSLIDVSGNRLVRLDPQSLAGVRAQMLHLGNNAFQRPPSRALAAIGYVGSLLFGHCPLTERLPTGAFRDVPTRELIIRNAGRLASIDRWAFDGLPLLRRLILSDCSRLRVISRDWLRDTPLLMTLILRNNALITLDSSGVPPSTRRLDLTGNPLRCDCTLHWLQPLVGFSGVEAAVVDRKYVSPAPLSHLQLLDNVTCQSPTASAPLQSLNISRRCAPTVLPLMPAGRKTELGEDVSLQCAATGHPLPNVKWTVDGGTELFDGQCNDNVCVLDGWLLVTFAGTENDGLYTCTAVNLMGSDSRTTQLRVRQPSMSLVAVSVASTFVTLSWNVSGARLTNFVLHKQLLPDEWPTWHSAVQNPGAGEPSLSRAVHSRPSDSSSDVADMNSAHELERHVVDSSSGYVVNNGVMRPHSFTFSHLMTGRLYRFSASIVHANTSYRLTSLDVRTHAAGFLLAHGRLTSYASVAAFAVPTVALIVVCSARCMRRLAGLRQHAHNRTVNQLARAGVLPSSSNHSDMVFLNLASGLGTASGGRGCVDDDLSDVLLAINETDKSDVAAS